MAITFWRFTFNGITAYGNGAYDLVGGSVKYRVLTRAKGRCECCGVHEHQRALELALLKTFCSSISASGTGRRWVLRC